MEGYNHSPYPKPSHRVSHGAILGKLGWTFQICSLPILCVGHAAVLVDLVSVDFPRKLVVGTSCVFIGKPENGLQLPRGRSEVGVLVEIFEHIDGRLLFVPFLQELEGSSERRILRFSQLKVAMDDNFQDRARHGGEDHDERPPDELLPVILDLGGIPMLCDGRGGESVVSLFEWRDERAFVFRTIGELTRDEVGPCSFRPVLLSSRSPRGNRYLHQGATEPVWLVSLRRGGGGGGLRWRWRWLPGAIAQGRDCYCY